VNVRCKLAPASIHLLVDSRSAHMTDRAKGTAARLGVTLYYIPPGLTVEFQPLDRRSLFLEGIIKVPVPCWVSYGPIRPADETGGHCSHDHRLIAAWCVSARTWVGYLHTVSPGFLLVVLLRVDH
jgi:hypothetical protein